MTVYTHRAGRRVPKPGGSPDPPWAEAVGADLTGAAELDKSCLEPSPLRLEFLHDLQELIVYLLVVREFDLDVP